MQATPTQRFKTALVKCSLIALLAAPAWCALTPSGVSFAENRALAALPALPRAWSETPKYTAGIDVWINDHFSMRAGLVSLNNRLRYAAFRQFPTVQVIQGRHGRIFLSAYEVSEQPYSKVFSVCGYQTPNLPAIIGEVRLFHEKMLQQGLPAKLLVVPSSPVVNMDQLPRWLARVCHASTTPMTATLASPLLNAAERADTYYPLAQMQEAARHDDLYPATFFHWAGPGARLASELSVARFWDIDPRQSRPLTSMRERHPSDISQTFPGIALTSEIELLDVPRSNISYCGGPGCVPEIGEIMTRFGEAVVYRNAQAAGNRLVILSDSFGPPAAGWYARYFKEVINININGLERLDRHDVDSVKRFLFRDLAHEKLMFLYHDATINAGRIGQDMQRLFPDA